MNRLILAAIAATLSACGGGGGSGGGGNAQLPAQQQQLGAYLGTWVADCDRHQQDSATITRLSDDSVRIANRTDYYAAANCSGAVVATQTQTADVTATYTGAVDASVVLAPPGSATTIRIDRVTASVGQYALAVTGTGVTRTQANGKPQWCINYGDGSATCIVDEGVQPGSSATGGLYARDNQLYELSPSGSTWVVNQRYTKR